MKAIPGHHRIIVLSYVEFRRTIQNNDSEKCHAKAKRWSDNATIMVSVFHVTIWIRHKLLLKILVGQGYPMKRIHSNFLKFYIRYCSGVIKYGHSHQHLWGSSLRLCVIRLTFGLWSLYIYSPYSIRPPRRLNNCDLSTAEIHIWLLTARVLVRYTLRILIWLSIPRGFHILITHSLLRILSLIYGTANCVLSLVLGKWPCHYGLLLKALLTTCNTNLIFGRIDPDFVFKH